jgi:hypothetical protein
MIKLGTLMQSTVAIREDVPAPVGRYLHWAGVQRNPRLATVRQRQHGRLRLRVDGPWYPLEANLLLEPNRPERIWTATIKPYPLVRISGRDSYINGAGRMLIRAYSRFNLSDVTGPQMDISALLTLLAELPIVPSAMLPSERLGWEEIDRGSVRATLRDHVHVVSGIFTFAPSGEPVRFETNERYRQVGKSALRTAWVVNYRKYARIDGWTVPTQFEAAWQLDDSVFSYARFEATRTEYQTIG